MYQLYTIHGSVGYAQHTGVKVCITDLYFVNLMGSGLLYLHFSSNEAEAVFENCPSCSIKFTGFGLSQQSPILYYNTHVPEVKRTNSNGLGKMSYCRVQA